VRVEILAPRRIKASRGLSQRGSLWRGSSGWALAVVLPAAVPILFCRNDSAVAAICCGGCQAWALAPAAALSVNANTAADARNSPLASNSRRFGLPAVNLLTNSAAIAFMRTSFSCSGAASAMECRVRDSFCLSCLQVVNAIAMPAPKCREDARRNH